MKRRSILMFMICFLLVSNTLVTLNMNVAIISMTRPTQSIDTRSNTSLRNTCGSSTLFRKIEEEISESANTNIHQTDIYNWDSYEKSLVLSAYMWLCWVSILPGSLMAQKYGSKIVLGYTVPICSIMSSLIPLFAKDGAKVVMCIRMLQGILSSFAVPGGMTTIIGNWSTANDRGKFSAAMSVGSSLTAGVGSYIFGYLGRYVHWKYIFHITSACGILWAILWYFLVSDFPSEHSVVVILKGKVVKSVDENNKASEKEIPIPWREIFTNVPANMSIYCFGALRCIFCTLVVFMPFYMNDVYGLDSNQAGLIISIPQFICAIISFFIGSLTDCIIKTKLLSVTMTRKVFGPTSCAFAIIPIITLALAKCNVNLLIICNTVATVLLNICFFSIQAVPVDLSSKFCGIIRGIQGTVSEMMTACFSIAIGLLIKMLPVEYVWKVVFLITAAFGLTTLSFSIWGSAKVQPWNEGSKKFRRNQKIDELAMSIT